MNNPVVIVARPCDLDLRDPVDARIALDTIVYDGSVTHPCDVCGKDLWLGPRQQAAIATMPVDSVMCFRCAIPRLGTDPVILHLENPQSEQT